MDNAPVCENAFLIEGTCARFLRACRRYKGMFSFVATKLCVPFFMTCSICATTLPRLELAGKRAHRKQLCSFLSLLSKRLRASKKAQEIQGCTFGLRRGRAGSPSDLG